MKVLWFTSASSLYDPGKHHYHGGGWIESLERLVTEKTDIELAIAFFHTHDEKKVTQNQTTYYPIKRAAGRQHPFSQLFNNWRVALGDINYDQAFQSIINDFQPDVIHVFGTEGPFAMVQEVTDVPVITHLQGLINPCLNTYFPVNNSSLDFLVDPNFFARNLLGSGPAFAARRFAKQAEREGRILRHARYVMGRTNWDKMVVSLYNSTARYFHVDEVLRPVFFQQPEQSMSSTMSPTKSSFSIFSTLSPTTYKGIDVILRTVKQLKAFNRLDYCWQIAGLTADDPLLRHYEKKEGIFHQDLGIRCIGRQEPEELVKLLQQADVFVHPSYIDNSPNSVCEAQMLGLPVIACNVGGLATLIKHDETGLLVPANGVFEIVHYLHLLAEDTSLALRIGQQAAAEARQRHDTGKIIRELENAYKVIKGG